MPVLLNYYQETHDVDLYTLDAKLNEIKTHSKDQNDTHSIPNPSIPQHHDPTSPSKHWHTSLTPPDTPPTLSTTSTFELDRPTKDPESDSLYWEDPRPDPLQIDLTLLTPSLNAALTAHFTTRPLLSQNMCDDFPETYLSMLCSPGSTIPPRLRPILSSYLTFYLSTIVPFRSYRLGCPEEADTINWHFALVPALRCIVDTLVPRERARLLRDEQVALVALWVGMKMERMRAVVEGGGRWEEVRRVAFGLLGELKRFWGVVRSERVELLMLRYVSEEGWNEGVVSGVEEAGRRKEEERRVRVRDGLGQV